MRRTLFTVLFVALFFLRSIILIENVNAGENGSYEGERFIPDETKLYVLENESSGYCLNLRHGLTSNGNEVNLYPLDSDDIATQLWQFEIVSYTEEGNPIVRIKTLCSENKCVDIRRHGKKLMDNGTQYSCIWQVEDDDNQLFIMEYTGIYSFRLKTYNKGFILSPRSDDEANMTQTALTVNPYTEQVYNYQVFYIRDENGKDICIKDIIYDLKCANEFADVALKNLSEYGLDDNTYNTVWIALKCIYSYPKIIDEILKPDLSREEINRYLDNCQRLTNASRQMLEKAISLIDGKSELLNVIVAIYGLIPTYDDIKDCVYNQLKTNDITLFTLMTDYSDYNIVKNIRSKYLMNQKDYKKFYDDQKSVGCTIISETFAYRIKHDICADPYDNEIFGWTSGGGTNWSTMKGVKCKDTVEYMNKVRDYLLDNTACTVCLCKPGRADHTVLAIGIKNNITSSDQITWDDILVFDPWEGRINKLSDMKGNYDDFAIAWSVRTTK